MEIRYTAPTPEEYVDLRIRTGMGQKNLAATKTALENSLFIVCLWNNQELIGFGRIVGDQGLAYLVSDIMVDPRYQGQGYGKLIMKEIDEYLEKNSDETAYVCLIVNKPADQLYKQFRFEYVQPRACGMKRVQTKKTPS